MKRSEMVINIAIELMSRLPEWEKQERLNFASEILQSIEIEGMLPPEQDYQLKEGEELGFRGISRVSELGWEDE